MASSKSAFVDDLGNEGMNAEIKDAIQIYADSLIALYGPAAAANNGKSDNWAAAINQILMGTAVDEKLGVAATKVKGKIAFKGGVRKRTIVGTTAITNNGTPYFATDENTYTITVPASKALPVGYVLQWLTGTTCLVWEFSHEALRAFELGGLGVEIVELGTFDASVFTNADCLVDLPATFNGQVEKLYAQVTKVLGGGGGTATLTLSIKPAGGAYASVGAPTPVVINTADALGAVDASAAITTNNVFHDGDLLKLTASAVTALTGAVRVFAKTRRRFGI